MICELLIVPRTAAGMCLKASNGPIKTFRDANRALRLSGSWNTHYDNDAKKS